MKFKIIALIYSLATITSLGALQKLDELQKRLEDIKPKLEAAIKKLEDGKGEIAKVYKDKLKPNLLDKLDASRAKAQEMVEKNLKGPIGMLESIPGRYETAGIKTVDIRNMITGTLDLADLYPTLTWIRDVPIKTIDDHLKTVKDDFTRVANKLNLQGGDPDTKKLFDHFDTAIAKLKSAIQRLEKVIKALQGEYEEPEE